MLFPLRSLTSRMLGAPILFTTVHVLCSCQVILDMEGTDDRKSNASRPKEPVRDSGGACSHDIPFGAPELISELNTGTNEEGLRLSRDGLRGWFWSDRARQPVPNTLIEQMRARDLYVATRSGVDEPFTTFAPFTPLATADVGEQYASETHDQLTLYFDRTDTARHIWRVRRSSLDQAYGSPEPVTALNYEAPDGKSNDTSPYVLADNSAIYFSSNRYGEEPNRLGMLDVFRAEIRDGEPQTPELLSFNDPRLMDTAPVVTPDELVIYFSSNRPSPTRLTIQIATRPDKNSPFSEPRPALQENAADFDFVSDISSDNCTLYLFSAKITGGSMDLYRAHRH